MRLSIVDQEKLSDIYLESVLVEDMTVGDMVGGSPTSGGSIENIDSYAPGDTRIPKILGGVQTRNGMKKKKKKSMKKSRKNVL